MDAPDDSSPPPPRARPADRRRGWAFGVGVGLAVFAVVSAIGMSIVALPLFFLASVLEPGGRIDHPFLRQGILVWALPIGLVFGIVTGVAIGIWVARGGSLPERDDVPSYLR